MKKAISQILSNKYFYIAIAAIIIVGIIARNLSKPEPGQEENHADISDLNYSTSNLNYSTDQLKLICENLLAAMDKYGTDVSSILSNLSDLNQDELIYIISYFGYKPYNDVGLATTWADINLFSTNKNLIGWLKAELSGNALSEVKAIFDNLNIPF